MENRYKINFDLKNNTATDIKFKQGDNNSAVLEVKLFDGGAAVDITSEVIEFRFKKADGNVVFQDMSHGVSIVSGAAQCILMGDVLSYPGTVICEIYRELGDVELIMPAFSFSVAWSIEGAVLSGNYISEIEGKIVEWQADIDGYVAMWQSEIDVMASAYDAALGISVEAGALEIADARGTYPTLGDRSNNVDEQLENMATRVADVAINVKNYGAVGDWNGTTGTDDTGAITAALAAGSTIYFPPGNYLVNGLTINNKRIIGTIDSKIYVGTSTDTEFAITFNGTNIVENITFEIAESSLKKTLVSLQNTTSNLFRNCHFISTGTTSLKTHNTLDLYGNNKDATFENCIFDQMTTGPEGGIWIREVSAGVTTSNIKFNNCTFNKSGGDEVIAAWGWNGTVDGVKLFNCTINSYEGATNNPDHVITLGASGTTNNIKCVECTFYIEYVKSTFCKSYSSTGDDLQFINCKIRIKKTNASAILFRNESGTTNYVINGCQIVADAAATLQYVFSNVLTVTNCSITVSTLSDKMFLSCSKITFNTIVANCNAKICASGDFVNNIVTLHNTVASILFQWTLAGTYKIRRNTISCDVQCTQMFYISDVTKAPIIIIEENDITKGGIYVYHIGITKISRNIFTTFNVGTISNPQITENIKNAVYYASGTTGW